MRDYAPDTYGHYAAITPSDSTNYADGEADAIYVGGAGNAVVVRPDGTTVTFSGLLAGNIYSIKSDRVNSTGTTATNMVALYFRKVPG